MFRATPTERRAYSTLTPAQPAAAPTDGDLDSLRNSVVRAIRARDWSRVGPLIGSLLAKFPTDAEALEWRRLLSQDRKSDLLAKLNPPQAEPNAAEVAKAGQLLEQGDYPGGHRIVPARAGE